jgi:hypothetical protein
LAFEIFIFYPPLRHRSFFLSILFDFSLGLSLRLSPGPIGDCCGFLLPPRLFLSLLEYQQHNTQERERERKVKRKKTLRVFFFFFFFKDCKISCVCVGHDVH